VTAISIAGRPVEDCDVDGAAVRITHGRDGVADPPTASTAALTIVVTAMPTWTVGDPLTIDVRGVRRFTGHLTDAAIVGHETPPDGLPSAVMQLTAVGAVSLLGVRDITGQEPWPAETDVARANRILAAADVPHDVTGLSRTTVVGQDVDRRTALSLIGDLAASVGAAVFDTPDGRVIFQPFTARVPGVQWVAWHDAAGDWANAIGIWAEWAVDSPNADLPTPLPYQSIVWEPVWLSTSALIVNHVTIGYGVDTAEHLTRQDPESVARYGRRHIGDDTQLADDTSADYRAGLLLARYARPGWEMRSVEIDPAAVSLGTMRDSLMALMCGNRVHIPGLPGPAPAREATMVVEGWTHILGAHTESLIFTLSDPAHSYAGIAWESVNPAIRWQDISPSLLWINALTDAALTGSTP
jgi:hypothetical protein